MARLRLALALWLTLSCFEHLAQAAQAEEPLPHCALRFAALTRFSDPASRNVVDLARSGNRSVWEKSAWGDPILNYSGFALKKVDYDAFKAAALAVAEISGSHPVIAIGRSPAPISTVLSILDENRIANLPISGFRHRMKTTGESTPLPKHYESKASEFAPLSSEHEKKLFEHFDQTLSSFLKSKKGTVFLMDVGESGASLFSMQQYLTKYAAERGLDVKFESIVMTNSFFSSNVDEMASFFGVRTHKIVLNDNKMVQDSLKPPGLVPETRSPWDRVAEFDGYDFDYIARTGKTTAFSSWEQASVDVPSGKPNSDMHNRFKSAVLVNMATDQSLLKTWKNPPLLKVDVPGIRWDPEMKAYRDESGKVWELKAN